MPQALPTILLIRGTLETLLDQMKVLENRQETKDSLQAAIMARFMSAFLEDEKFGQYVGEVGTKLEGGADLEHFFTVAQKHAQEAGGATVDLEPLLRNQARMVLEEFVKTTRSETPEEELLALVNASFQL